MKVTLCCPSGTVILFGGVTTLLLLVRFTRMPPAPEIDDSVTVPVELWPPYTVDGLKVTDATLGGEDR